MLFSLMLKKASPQRNEGQPAKKPAALIARVPHYFFYEACRTDHRIYETDKELK
jgi:hypothetical protein